MSTLSVTAFGSSAGGIFAHFKLLIDGRVVGQATTTSAKKVYTFDVDLDRSKPHAISIQYDNDGVVAGSDRNLFVSSLQLDGRALALTGDAARYLVSSGATEVVRAFNGAMPWNGSLVVDVPASAHALTPVPAFAPAPIPVPPPLPAPTASGTLKVKVTGDHWNGAPQFIVLVDGKQIGGVQTTTARRAYGEWQEVTLSGDFGAAPRKVEVKFINDAWGGSGKDRNLYVDAIELNGVRYEGEKATNTASSGAVHPTAAVMAVNGTLGFSLSAAAPTPVPAPVASPTAFSDVTTVLSGNQLNLVLTGTAAVNGTGNALANQLSGNSAANVLDGGAGADVMKGGTGNDTYVVDSMADFVSEQAGEGTDIVQSLVSYVLPDNIENLLLVGNAALNGTGNALDNRIVGNGSANVLDGGSGNDTLDGGAGADAMRGGIGNDSYVVDNVGDVVTEHADQGSDTVLSSVNFLLGSNVENLILTGNAISGTGNALANRIVGNGANNALDGGTGDDMLIGGAGDDRLEGAGGIDTAGFGGNFADYRMATSGGITTVTALKGTDGIDTLTGIEKLAFADKTVEIGDSVSPPESGGGAKLTRYNGTVKTTHDGQVIENLDIYAGGTGIEVLHKNVIVRNVRVHHADGDGIRATNANNLLIEKVEVINTDPPSGQRPEEAEYNNIEIVRSADVTIRGVTVREGSTGIYLVQSPRAEIDHVDGYDFHGPFPRGQFVQFNNSPDGSLKNFYTKSVGGESHVEDNVSIYASARVRVENGVIDGNSSRTGVGVMVEDGSAGTVVKNVDVIHQGNGAFSAYTDSVTFIDVRSFDSFNYDQGRGAPASNGVQFVVNGSNVVFDDATYTRPGNPGNIVWQPVKPTLLDVTHDPNATPMSHEPFVNDWHWAN